MAKRLEDKPFHLVASHCQQNPKQDVVAYIKGKGLAADTPNFTVTSFGRHPKVKGNGYVPYYMVFDHRGDLVYHHMCGAYHGGDGLRMIEWVDELLEKAPAIYLGEDPFETYGALAERIAAKKGLARSVKILEAELAAAHEAEAETELERLRDAVGRYRDRRLRSATSLLASKPSGVLAALRDLKKELAGTRMADPVNAEIRRLDGSDTLARSLAAEKAFGKIVRGLEKRKGCKACKARGSKQLSPECAACREDNASAVAKAVQKLEKLVADHPGLPITETVSAYLAPLR